LHPAGNPSTFDLCCFDWKNNGLFSSDENYEWSEGEKVNYKQPPFSYKTVRHLSHDRLCQGWG